MGIALTDYRRALEYLFARTTGESRLGLERTAALLALLGDPHRAFRSLHIAGTNGKGSVAATLDGCLRARGYRVAKYTSPHLVDFRERLLIDGRPVDSDPIVEFIERWTPDIERIGATFFEATTAMAFDLFARAGAEIAVVETGLGGRLDATNVVVPVVAGVTNIAIDHTEYLGTTRTQIAREKAGIFKPEAGAVIGEPDTPIGDQLVAHAEAVGAAPIVRVGAAYPLSRIEVGTDATRFEMRVPAPWVAAPGASRPATGTMIPIATPLLGRHQAANAATAVAMLDVIGEGLDRGAEALRRALASVSIPGRFQRWGKVIFDVAHNPDGAAVLADTLRTVSPERPIAALVTVLGDKDWRGILAALRPVVDHFVLSTAPTAPASRRWDLDAVVRESAGTGTPVEGIRDFDVALDRAMTRGATVVVTGSFHTVGDAMARLQVDPLAG